MAHVAPLPAWSWAAPVAGWAALGLTAVAGGGWVVGAAAVALVGSVLAAVHHAEVVAHRVGEPYGSLVLAVAVTVIEVALIVSLMLASSEGSKAALARDTVFAAIMIILSGIVGLCLIAGSGRHGEQRFAPLGVNAALAGLAALGVLTLVLPNFTTTVPGPVYSGAQLGLAAIASLAIYGAFVMIQTVQHRDYFLPEGPAEHDAAVHAAPPPNRVAALALALLVVALVATVLLAKALSPAIEGALDRFGAPKAAVGVFIAGIVLLPEGLAAYRAARADRLQTSINLALGSALASIGLTIPAVALLSLANGWTLVLGLDAKSMVLLALALFVAALSLGGGRTTIFQGVVLLAIFATYLATTLIP